MTAFKIRTIYLLMYMGFAFWRVYYNVYLEENVGLKGSEIGTLNAIMQATIFFVVTIWGVVADKRGIRPALRFAVLVTAISVFLLQYFNSFWILLFYIPLLTIFYHPLGPLNDALAVQYTEAEKKHSFGSFRLWGSLGWALASIIGALLFKILDLELKSIFFVSGALFLCLIPFLTTRRKKRVFKPNFESISLKELLKNKPLLLFMGVMILFGITCSPVFAYLNLYFTHLNAGKDIVGYAYAIMAISEVPLFLIGVKLLNRFGAPRVILIAMATMFLRFIFYGLFPGIGLGLIIGAFQGISLAFFLVGAVDFLKKLMPGGRHATAQSLIWGGFVGIGQMIGSLFIGFLLDTSGMVGVMKIFIGISAFCLIVSLFYFKSTLTHFKHNQ